MNTLTLSALIVSLASNDGAVRRAIVALSTRDSLLSDISPSKGKLSDRAEVRYMSGWILDGAGPETFLASNATGKPMTVQRAWRWKPARNNPEIARALVLRNAEIVLFVLHQMESARRAAAARLASFDAPLDFDAEPVTKRYGT